MSIQRAEVIARIAEAFKGGQSASAFISQMRAKGLGYRTSQMYADWYSATKVYAVEGALANIRKDYYPTEKTIASVEWDFKSNVEYMYKAKVYVKRGQDISERFVNVMSDIPLTPRMIEEEIKSKWSVEWEYTKETLEKVTAWTAYRTTL